MGDFDDHVSMILEELETITELEVEKSFEDCCSRLRKCFESLKLTFTEERFPEFGALVQQDLMGIRTVHFVCCSWNPEKKKQTKHLFLRLLMHIKNQYPLLLVPDQMKEIDAVWRSLAFEDPEDSMPHETVVSSKELNLSEKQISYPRETVSLDNKIRKPTFLRVDLPTDSQSRAKFSPLLDFHADYDEGSLPSPKHESVAPLSLLYPIGLASGAAKISSEALLSKSVITEESSIQLCETNALSSVASYHQRYLKTNSDQANHLPSPSPSEDGGNNDDNLSEVTSSKVSTNTRIIDVVTSCNSSFTFPPIVQLLDPVKTAQHSISSTNHFKTAQLLVFGDFDVQEKDPVGVTLNQHKHRASEDSSIVELSLKRPRYVSAYSPVVQVNSGRGGCLEESATVATQVVKKVHRVTKNECSVRKPSNEQVNSTGLDINIKVSMSNAGNGQNTMAGAVPHLSLPSLIQNVAVNPTMIMELMTGHKKLETRTQRLTIGSSQFSNIRSEQIASISGDRVPSNSYDIVQNQAGKSKMPPATFSLPNSQGDSGTVLMKPHDPRRILQCDNFQKSYNTPAVQIKPIASSGAFVNKNLSEVLEKAEQTQFTVLPSQIKHLPDIAGQFTKNQLNVAYMMTISQLASSQLVSQIQSTPQSILTTKREITSVPTSADSSNLESASGSAFQGRSAGAFQSTSAGVNMGHILDGYDEQQKAGIQKERARRIEEQNKLYFAQKLSLVLDIDHTLLNSAKFEEVDIAHDDQLRKKEDQDCKKPLRHLFRLQHMGIWTKLRPGIWNFLDKASKLYELHLYTMGNKLYATEMAKLLDPTGSLFAGRVISRGDDSEYIDGDEGVPKIKDLDGVLGMESSVVIIDDSVTVWPLNKLNLIVVERYTFFPCSRFQFCLPGPSLLEIDHDERTENGTLASSLAVIERIHSIFFSRPALNDADVRIILSAEQRKILAGCRIVFSRIFPVAEANPHLHPLWQIAEQFGAICTNQIDEQVTHVVANSLGTKKVNWALSTRRYVVKAGWVEASALLYRRASEQDFAVEP